MMKKYLGLILVAMGWVGCQSPGSQDAVKDDSEKPIQQTALDKIDQKMFHYTGAGVEGLTMKIYFASNPMLSSAMRDKYKDAAVVYHWRANPWAEKVVIEGVPEKDRGILSSIDTTVFAVRQFVSHSFKEIGRHYQVTESRDGGLEKIMFSGGDAEKGFEDFVLWAQRNGKVSKMQLPSRGKKTGNVIDFYLKPFTNKFMIASILSKGSKGEGKVDFVFDRNAKWPILKRINIKAGPIEVEYPVTMEMNPTFEEGLFN